MKKIATWLLCLALAGAILLPVPSTVNSSSVDNSGPVLLADDPPPPPPPPPWGVSQTFSA
jgi:hypothetical protein